ncbi:MAG: hypothetical protein JNM86_14340 [Phycisphaerae bacterium]|nr:hypothetical protein [Phycisphaerae bacterium]
MNDLPGQFRVMEERETPRGWSYRVVVGCGEDHSTEHEVTLSWVDHNYWCGGTQAPSVTAEQVLETLFEAVRNGVICDGLRHSFGGRLPSQFDLSLARRIVPSLDAKLKRVG